MRTWQTEFGPEYKCPPKPAGFGDSSWHNEINPSYLLTCGDHEIRIWMQHVDKSERESALENEPRFFVTVSELDGDPTDLVKTDDFDMAVACCWLAVAYLKRGLDHGQIEHLLIPFNDLEPVDYSMDTARVDADRRWENRDV